MEKRPFQFMRGKVALAVIGVCLIGGTSAVLAARTVHEMSASLAYSSNNVTGNSQSSTGAATSTTSATATTHSGVGGANPTATPFIVGQPCSVDGSIRSINSSGNTFTVHHSGVSYTIDVNARTSFTGQTTTFAGLQVGWDASVNGTAQSAYTCLASTVNSSLDT